MNPLEKFVNDFQSLFPNATITFAEDGDEYVIYHNVDLSKINYSDQCAFEHISDVLSLEGYDYWLNYMGE